MFPRQSNDQLPYHCDHARARKHPDRTQNRNPHPVLSLRPRPEETANEPFPIPQLPHREGGPCCRRHRLRRRPHLQFGRLRVGRHRQQQCDADNTSASTDGKTLRVAMELAYPPFETKDDAGNPEGLAVDFIRDFGAAYGYDVQIENTALGTALFPRCNRIMPIWLSVP